jgi:cell division protein ZapA
MSSKIDTEVIIGGKVFTLSGYESEEYLQKVASYINNKINEYSKIDSFRRQTVDMQNVLMQINIADDFFKAKKQIALVEEDIQSRENELYDLKHELISCQIKLESAQKQVRDLQREINENAKKLIRLETKLGESKEDQTPEIHRQEDKRGGNGKNGNRSNDGKYINKSNGNKPTDGKGNDAN